MGEWSDFFIGTGGAAATLTGLIFVGVSINLTKILSIPKLPERALISLIILLQILFISLLFLVPKQSLRNLGIEILFISLVAWIFIFKIDTGVYMNKQKEFKRRYFFNIFLSQVALIPYFVGGTEVLVLGENGFYWIVPGVLLSFLKAVLDAWVLLVEINR